VRVNVGDIGKSSFTLIYEIAHAVSERLVASGKTVMVSYDYEKRSSVPLPPATRDLLQRVKGERV
jgi:acyl-CoA thioester hydrolase